MIKTLQYGQRGKLSQHNKGHKWQTHRKHHSQWWITEKISFKIREKTRMSTLTTIIQHSFRSHKHGNQRRKSNKRNPYWKRRSKYLTLCKLHDTIHCVDYTLLLFSCSVMSNSLWPPWTAAWQVSLSFPIPRRLPKLMSIESMKPSNHLTLCHSHLLLPSIFPSIRVFSSELALRIRWPNYWSFSISLSNEYSGLISFRIGWLDLLAVKGTLESSPTSQFKSINSLVLSDVSTFYYLV